MFIQFIKFSLVGLLNTAIHYGVFYGLFQYMGVPYLLASGIGFFLAVTNSYLINKHWTFKSKGVANSRQFTKFMIVNLVSLSINLAGMTILVELFNMYPPIAQILTIGFTLIVNFAGNKLWTFREVTPH